MQSIEHITTDQIRRYSRREIGAAETLRLQMHVGECAICRERLATMFDATQAFAAIEKSFDFADFDDEPEHLTYQQLEMLVDNQADEVEREIADSHFAVCQDCRRDFADLQRFRQIAETSTVAAAATLVALETQPKSWWQQLLAFDFSRSPVPAFGVTAAILLVVVGGWFLARSNQSSEGEIAKQHNRNLNVLPSPALSNVSRQNQQLANQNSNSISDSTQTDSNIAAPNAASAPANENLASQPREAAPLVALSDNGKHIELNANNDLRGLENSSPETQAVVRRVLQTGKLRISAAAREITNGQNGVLMSGDGSSGVAFALRSPVGKIVREQQPRLQWKSLPGAIRYKVAVADQNFRVVAESGDLTTTEWTLPKPLARGANYAWQVTAIDQSNNETVSPAAPAPAARFRVLDEPSANRINKLEKSNVKSNLARGIVFAEAGLLDEARREFQLLLARNPRSTIAKRLLANLKSVQ